MAINGIESLIYGVPDVQEVGRFFDDFGLVRDPEQPSEGLAFTLPEGSHVVIRHRDDPALVSSQIEGDGVREVIWGVDGQSALERLARGLASDRELTWDSDGTVHFIADFGVPMGLRVFAKKPVVSAPDPVNAPGLTRRLNHHRKWRRRAYPKVINHVVFATPDYEAGYRFMRDRLNFRLSDSQAGYGKYVRADGTTSHHSILLLNANAPVPGMTGKLSFHHANFGVEDMALSSC
ncbi:MULTISPECIES: VOC family protein [Sphingomonadaceae]|uniref:Glyoxalase family protein n=1 Tax=Sphingomonas sp. SH TaxID=849864 RepID=A0A125QWU0_9SPHN|nr:MULTISPECIES: VOC family protein [Sphingomonadaceae]QBM06453.1 Glyoxalase family protein [uncultured bacterium]AGS18335.1 glyoxalase [Sphingobium sp. YBL2]ALZ45878.1 Glyoxalase family protein [Sphingomonas sp. SH]QBM06484.1 glyoxalase family protein [uncultured bacterium]QBM06505.1 glyoxalase family protein [uncultured bacterium]